MMSLRDLLNMAGGEEVNVVDFDGQEFGTVGLHGGKRNMALLTKYGDCPVLNVSRKVGRKPLAIILSTYVVGTLGVAERK